MEVNANMEAKTGYGSERRIYGTSYPEPKDRVLIWRSGNSATKMMTFFAAPVPQNTYRRLMVYKANI
jgi:hypothetical protein